MGGADDRAAIRHGTQVEPDVPVRAPLPPDPAAPDATAGDGLRSAIRQAVVEIEVGSRYPDVIADALLALPALRDVLAAADRDAELRTRVQVAAVCPTECDLDCDVACHEAHHSRHTRTHQIDYCPAVVLGAILDVP